MPPKRTPARASAASSPPVLDALLVAAAVALGLGVLIARGRMSWPPTQLLQGGFTVAGCLALVGPLVVGRRSEGATEHLAGVGELTWLSAGLLIWFSDLAAAARGEWRDLAWATPIGARTLGIVVLAIMIGGWRCGLGGRNWSWTNVIGWALGVFWVGMALGTINPGSTGGFGLASGAG